MVLFFDSLAEDVTLTEVARNAARTKAWICSDNETQTWIGNPARSSVVREYLAGLMKEKRDSGDVSNKSLPLTLRDIDKIQAYYRNPDRKTRLNEYQIEIMLYVSPLIL